MPLGIARLGFNRSDDDMHEPDQWWASLNIPASSMEGMTDGVDAGRLTAVRLGLCLKGVYTYAPEVAGTHRDLRLLLRPGSTDARDSPQVATGYVTYLTLDLAGISLGQSDEGKSTGDENASSGHREMSETKLVRAIDEKLDKLFVLVKWLAALVAALIIGFALARH
jgi:phosphate:Na+ symporter